jgi:type I restriction enzyme S subunit
MKKGWTYKKIKDVGEVIGGTTPSTTNPEFWGGDICWISPAELHGEHYLYDSVKKITAKAVSAKSLKELPVGTVILSSRAPIGKIAINKVPMYCNQGFKCVVCGPELYNEFLYWWFYGKVDYLNSLGTGATFKEISKTVVENIVVPIAPIKEQKRIVKRLDAAFEQIDELKANAEKQLTEARALFQKSLSKAMEPKEGWEEKTLKEVSTISGDYGLSVSSKPFDGVRYLRITDITDLGDLNDDKVSANVDDSKKQEELEEGDILFARTGATVGKTLVYRKEFGECLFAGYLIRYRLNKDVISPRFMYYITHSDEYYDWVNVNQEAAAQPNISAKKYNLLPIKYPSLSEQQRIVERLDSISENVRKYEEIQRKIIAECDALKQALLRQVFE